MATVIEKLPHSVNGKLKGSFIKFDDGKHIYMAFVSGEKTKNLSREHNAWVLPISAIRQAQAKGCTEIAIRYKVGSQYSYYMTPIQDFIDLPSERHSSPLFNEPMRRLNRNLFAVNSTRLQGNIEKNLTIR